MWSKCSYSTTRGRTRSSTKRTPRSAGAFPGARSATAKVFGSPFGEPAHRYLAEWEFPDQDAFKAATRSEEFAATGTDARERGLPRPNVEFVALDSG